MRVAGEQLENPEVDLEDLKVDQLVLEDLRVDLWRSRTRGFNQGDLLQYIIYILHISLGQKKIGCAFRPSQGMFRVVRRAQKTIFKFIDP